MILAPILAVITLLAWAVSSPVGSSPDDDFHLVSIWCASPSSEQFCEQTGEESKRLVPEALVGAPCFAFDATKSASCQADLSFTAVADTATQRGNFAGGYPPIYYATMGLFAGTDIAAAPITMRVVNVLIFVGIATALFLLLPVARRSALVWSWVVTMVPLGLFVLASNNPSAWAITGVGMGWMALLGYFETRGFRKVALGALFVLSAIMAAGSRSDGAIYTVLGIVAVGILSFARTKTWMLSAILPVVVAAFCITLFRLSRPVASLTQGLPGGDSGTAVEPTDIFGRFVYNILEGPSLWAGIFGDRWGLGWLDTSMPAIVWFGGLASFVAVGFAAAGRLDWHKLAVLIGGVLVLWLMPTIVLISAGDTVGENMQPRYLLPLIVMFTGILLLRPQSRPIRFTRVQVLLVASVLSVTQLIALNLNLRRYVTGFDDFGVDLDTGIEWWWNWAISPMTVWIIGSAAFAALLFILLPRHAGTGVPGRLYSYEGARGRSGTERGGGHRRGPGVAVDDAPA